MFSITGNFVDIKEKRIYPAEVVVKDGTILSVEPRPDANVSSFILPGFIDAHVHIESSMLVPAQFARMAVVHGTVATVSDPHEIANVCGIEGVEFMIENGRSVPFKFYFGAPSCVPATTFETAGASLGVDDIRSLLEKKEILYLSEMMNYPGVLADDPDVMSKIAIAHQLNKPVDGHAPGLRGSDLYKYFAAGISTDHECFTEDEAREKLAMGMKVLIREGSAAKNFDALIELLQEYPEMIMFCSDDKHPDSLEESHINRLCARAVSKGIDVFNVLQAACVNPVMHYKLKVGLLQAGDPADFVVVQDLENFNVLKTFIDGQLVAEAGQSTIRLSAAGDKEINRFNCSSKQASDFEVALKNGGDELMPVIEALNGQLITNKLLLQPRVIGGMILPDTDRDILKIAVVNRYKDVPVATAFIKNFGLKRGAIASSVAHDSHNIVVVGVDDGSICRAVNALILEKGGICCVDEEVVDVLPLPIAGLMSSGDAYKVASRYKTLDASAKQLGSTLDSPFMTLSFMALLVIPSLKLSDKGLFDGHQFQFLEFNGGQ